MTRIALLDHLAAKAGLDRLTLDADDACSLAFGDRVVLTFRWLPDDEALVLFSVLGTLPPQGRQALLEQLLRANRFGRETGGATLSLDEARPPRVLLAQRFDTRHVDAGSFVQAVEGFAAVAGHWMARLDGAAPAAAAPPPAALAWPGPGSFA